MVILACDNGHQVAEEVVCPDCGLPLTWAGRTSEKQIVACCWHCWGGKGRNFIVRDILKSLNLKGCPKCDSSQLSFLKKA